MIMNIHLIKDPGGRCALTQTKQNKKIIKRTGENNRDQCL